MSKNSSYAGRRIEIDQRSGSVTTMALRAYYLPVVDTQGRNCRGWLLHALGAFCIQPPAEAHGVGVEAASCPPTVRCDGRRRRTGASRLHRATALRSPCGQAAGEARQRHIGVVNSHPVPQRPSLRSSHRPRTPCRRERPFCWMVLIDVVGVGRWATLHGCLPEQFICGCWARTGFAQLSRARKSGRGRRIRDLWCRAQDGQGTRVTPRREARPGAGAQASLFIRWNLSECAGG